MDHSKQYYYNVKPEMGLFRLWIFHYDETGNVRIKLLESREDHAIDCVCEYIGEYEIEMVNRILIN